MALSATARQSLKRVPCGGSSLCRGKAGIETFQEALLESARHRFPLHCATKARVVGPTHSSVRMNSDWSIMRILLTLVLAIVPAVAQIPLVSLLNASRPGSDFQIGDRFEIVITAAPNQRISVRTSRQGRTDWSPVVGSTDSTGRWSTGGQFEKRDLGDWGEMWTARGKLASP